MKLLISLLLCLSGSFCNGMYDSEMETEPCPVPFVTLPSEDVLKRALRTSYIKLGDNTLIAPQLAGQTVTVLEVYSAVTDNLNNLNADRITAGQVPFPVHEMMQYRSTNTRLIVNKAENGKEGLAYLEAKGHVFAPIVRR